MRAASELEVKNIESELGVELPDDYLVFLNKVGYVFWFGTSLFGIAPDDYDSVVYMTKYARSVELPVDFRSRPENTIVFTDYGGGGYYFLYCNGSERCGEVVEILDECRYKESRSWPSIWAFIEEVYI